MKTIRIVTLGGVLGLALVLIALLTISVPVTRVLGLAAISSVAMRSAGTRASGVVPALCYGD